MILTDAINALSEMVGDPNEDGASLVRRREVVAAVRQPGPLVSAVSHKPHCDIPGCPEYHTGTSTPAARPTCAGRIAHGLQAGRPCSLSPRPGSAYCKRHEPERESTDPLPVRLDVTAPRPTFVDDPDGDYLVIYVSTWTDLLAKQSLLGETLRRHREVIEAASAPAAITVACVSCGQPVVDRPDDPVIHVGCAMANDEAAASLRVPS